MPHFVRFAFNYAIIGTSVIGRLLPFGSSMKPPMAFGWYKNINDQDMAAIVAYLRSLKPLPFGGAPSAKP